MPFMPYNIQLFNALRLDDSAVEKLQTCVHPIDVEKVAWRVIEKAEVCVLAFVQKAL